MRTQGHEKASKLYSGRSLRAEALVVFIDPDKAVVLYEHVHAPTGRSIIDRKYHEQRRPKKRWYFLRGLYLHCPPHRQEVKKNELLT